MELISKKDDGIQNETFSDSKKILFWDCYTFLYSI